MDSNLEQIYKNKCPVCDKPRVYKTKSGYLRANKLNLACKSCKNSIQRGGTGNLYKDNMKKCSNCNDYKVLEDFHKYKDGSKIQYHSTCKLCAKLLSMNYHRNIYKFSKYNIVKSDYEELLLKQNSKCDICETTEFLHIDHCHNTGKVRGLLCPQCNKALGLFKDSEERLEKAIKYLRKINE